MGVCQGPLRAEATELGGRARLALAYLVRQRHRLVPREELAEAVWDQTPPRSWEAALRGLASRLRNWLADAGIEGTSLTSSAGCFSLTVPPGTTVDVELAATDTEGAATALAGGDPAAALAAATAAEDVAAQVFLPGSSGPWVEECQGELRELRLRALELRSDAAAATGQVALALRCAETAATLEPLRETAHLRVMAAHARAGNRGEALRAYERCRRLLAEELGVSPSPETEAAYVALLGTEPPGGPGTTTPRPGPPAAPPEPAPHRYRLPAPVASLVGRDHDVAELCPIAVASRLLTLTGPGGVGKTRLALEVAQSLAADHAAGAVLVDLGLVDDGRLVAAHALAALGLAPPPPGTAPQQALAAHVSPLELLVVLDNCEHVRPEAAALAEHLLGAAPGLRIIATSREHLHVAGETVRPVAPLDLPDPALPPAEAVEASAATRLFVERARAARPSLRVDGPAAAAVVAVCRRLDGLPLALELAAARAAVLSVEEIADRVEDRFRLLTGGPAGRPDRQRTLRAAIDWSYEALPPAPSRLFRRLSAFGGSFTLDAAAWLAAPGTPGDPDAPGDPDDPHDPDVLDDLAGLVARSLVAVEAGPGPTRYRLLESLRAYGREQAEATGEARDAGARLQAWALRLAERGEHALGGPDQTVWLHRIEEEHPNLRAALAADLGSGTALRLAAALGRFWELRGHLDEGRDWLRQVLDRSADSADGAHPGGGGTGGGGDAGDRARARALNAAGLLAQRQGDYRAARSRLEEAVVVRRRHGDALGVAIGLHGLGNVRALEGDLAGARASYEESLAIGGRHGDRRLVAASLANLGWVAHAGADFDGARRRYEEALAVRRALDDRHGEAIVLGHLGDLAFQSGDLAGAAARATASFDAFEALGDRVGMAAALGTLGHLALAADDPGAAREQFERSLALARDVGSSPALTAAHCNLADAALVENDLGKARSHAEEAARTAGEGRDGQGEAHALLHLARVALAEGSVVEAASCYARARRVRGHAAPDGLTAEWLEGVAAVAAATGAPEDGARLLGAAAALRRGIGAPVPPSEAAHHRAVVTHLRALLGDATFGAAHRAGEAMVHEDATAAAGALLDLVVS